MINIRDGEKNGEKAPFGGLGEGRAFPLFPVLAVLFLSFAVYFNALSNEFVYDDIPNVVENPWIKDFSFLPKIFTSQVAGFNAGYTTSYYRPLVHVIYLLAYSVFGLSAWGFHFVNILFHAGTSVLLFFIASRLLPESRPSPFPRMLSPALLIALLFAAHPVHTEAVAWIAGIMDVSFTFFFLLSLYLYMRSGAGNKVTYTLSVASFFLSTLCKEPALTLPFILIAYDHIFGKISFRLPRHYLRYLPYLAVSGIYFALRLNALGGFVPSKTPIDLTVYQYGINILHLFAQYVGKLILPVNLSVLHGFHPLKSIFETRGLLSLVLVSAAALFAYRMRREKAVSFSLFLLVLPLLPAFYIRSIAGESVFAERYLYLPSSGFIIILVSFLTRLKLPVFSPDKILIVFFPVLIVAYSAGTLLRNATWKDSYTLWIDTVKKNPDSAAAHKYLGYAFYANGKTDEAIEQYAVALNLKPDDAEARLNLGAAYYGAGRIDRAIEQFQAVIRLKPAHAQAHFNLARACADAGLISQAVEHYQIAVALNPEYAEAYNGLGIAYAMKGMTDEATNSFSSAVRLDPGNRDYYDNLMKAQGMKKLPGQAGRP